MNTKKNNICRALQERERLIDPEAVLKVMKTAAAMQRETYDAVKDILPGEERDRITDEWLHAEAFIAILELDIHKHRRETFRDI